MDGFEYKYNINCKLPIWLLVIYCIITIALAGYAMLLGSGVYGTYVDGELDFARFGIMIGFVAMFFIVTVVLHELLHGVGIYKSVGKVGFGVAISQWMPCFYSSFKGSFFNKKQMIITLSLPQIITILCPILFFIGAYLGFGIQFEFLVIWVFIINLTGSVSDYWLLHIFRKANKDYMYKESGKDLVAVWVRKVETEN
jgi:hypothetical protein